MECVELNWLCEHMKKVRNSLAVILILNWAKQSVSLWLSLKHQKLRFDSWWNKWHINLEQIIFIVNATESFHSEAIWTWCHFIDYSPGCRFLIGTLLRIWSHLLKKSLMENLIFCTVCFGVSFWSFSLCSLKFLPGTLFKR